MLALAFTGPVSHGSENISRSRGTRNEKKSERELKRTWLGLSGRTVRFLRGLYYFVDLLCRLWLADSYRMNQRLIFHVTKHMSQRVQERGISLEDAKNVVRHGTVERLMAGTGGHGGIVKVFAKTDSGRRLIVIAEIKSDDCWLTTAYYEN